MSSVVPDAQTSSTASSLAPGFRFHPTDEELISYYLKRKVSGRAIRVDAIAEVDLYKFEPWDLPAQSRIRCRDLEWYFFSPLDRKYSNRSRTNRATAQGYWKTTGKDRPVRHGPRVVGMKKTLVFHVGRAPKGERTNWVMHEYRLEDESRSSVGMQQVYEQDGYVVCRIFQKNGVGPQNGAQYGAPFVEEEWEVEEEAADCLVMMADVVEDEGNQVDDEVTIADNLAVCAEDQVNQEEHNPLECVSVVQVNPSVKNIGSHHGERAALLDEVVVPTVTNKIFDFVNKLGSTANVTEDSKSVFYSEVHSPPDRDDGYIELNDLFNPVDVETSLDISNTEYVLEGIDEQFLHDVFDVEDFVGGNLNQDEHSELSQMSRFQENSHMQSNDLINSFDASFSCFEDENSTFYDAPSYPFTLEKIDDEIKKLHPSFCESSSYEPSGDFMMYFDASDDNMPYDTMGFSDSSEYLSSYIWDHSAAEEANDPTTKMPSEASASSVIAGGPSSALFASHQQYGNDYDSVSVAPDFPRNDGADKPMAKSLVNMLASISAPPAFASEFPSGTGKSVGHISSTDPGSAVRITTGLIQIRGLSVAGNEEHWPLQKRSDISLLLSYHDEVHKSVGFEPISKFQGGALSLVTRGGLCLFIFSALILTLSYTVGMSIYGK